MKKCRCCGNVINEEPILQYKNMPGAAQNFPNEEELQFDIGEDIGIYYCKFCGLMQILQEPVYYYRDVIRAIAVSEDMKEFRKEYFENFVNLCHLEGKKIIEIGAGCGEYMELMAQSNVMVYGLENLKESVQKAKKRGLYVHTGFVENEIYRIPDAPYDGFYIMNYLEHIPHPKEFLRGVVNNLSEGAYGLIEVPNGDFIIKENMFSEFMLDHLCYFTKDSLEVLLKQCGYDVISCESIWHEYILAAIVKKRKQIDVSKLQSEQERMLKTLERFLEKNKEKRIAVWGAGHQALAVMALANMQNYLSCVIDSAEFKQNRYTPATHIPIVSPEKINEWKIEIILVMAGSYTEEVCKKIYDNWKNVKVETLDTIGFKN